MCVLVSLRGASRSSCLVSEPARFTFPVAWFSVMSDSMTVDVSL